MILIAALGTDRVIGSAAGMPWDVPEEYQHFLELVAGQTVLMGRKSWEIFGADLTTTRNLVLTRRTTAIPGAQTVSSIGAAIESSRRSTTLFCAGGASVYAQAIPFATALYLSQIKGDFDGDSYFPAIETASWRVESCEDHARFEFVVYRRRV